MAQRKRHLNITVQEALGVECNKSLKDAVANAESITLVLENTDVSWESLYKVLSSFATIGTSDKLFLKYQDKSVSLATNYFYLDIPGDNASETPPPPVSYPVIYPIATDTARGDYVCVTWKSYIQLSNATLLQVKQLCGFLQGG